MSQCNALQVLALMETLGKLAKAVRTNKPKPEIEMWCSELNYKAAMTEGVIAKVTHESTKAQEGLLEMMELNGEHAYSLLRVALAEPEMEGVRR